MSTASLNVLCLFQHLEKSTGLMATLLQHIVGYASHPGTLQSYVQSQYATTFWNRPF